MPRKLHRFAMVFAAAWIGVAAFPAGAQEAGRVILSIGDVTIQRGGQPRPAPVGSTFEKGDTIRVGATSNAQLRFIDDAVVALRPGSELTVDDYNWPGASNGLERAFFSLLKGGLRTVTGAIGKANRQNYEVRTPTSTIGIRGTNFNLVHCDAECANLDGSRAAPGTYGGIFDGRINVGNAAGERVFGANEFFRVASRDTPPEALIGPPPFLGDRLAGTSRRQGQKGSESSENMTQSGVNADGRALADPPAIAPPIFLATEERLADGSLGALFVPITHVVTVSNHSFSNNGESDSFAVNVADMVFAGSGAAQTLVSVVVRPNGLTGQDGGKGMVGPGGTDMVGYGAAVNAHWGRWVDGTVTDDTAPGGTFTPPGGVHYLYSDQITPAEIIAAKTGAFNYNVRIGGTNPTDNLGNIGTFSSGAVNMNFTNRTAALTAVWSVGSSNYSVTALPGTISITPGIGAGFDANANNFAGSSCSGTPGSCGNVASGTPIQQIKAQGVFIGATGNHLTTGIGTTQGTQTTSQVQLFFCPTCP